ncbi:hypothetical protein [Streptomyces bluensis]|uniref:Uncharacterized protein n=1 Tax=Streptomyces bluensis TaxID=33897 RepID=A0ABW6UTZ3_9ACTN
MADVRPVAGHLRHLIASGRSIAAISQDSGVSLNTIRKILKQRRPEIWRTTADKLLALPDVPDKAALIDSTGTVRRLQALVVMGHSQQTISGEVGCTYTYISMLTHGQRATVTVALALAVQAAYDKLSMHPGPSVQGKARAARYGWNGPLSWDDDTIDDPNALPMTDAAQPVATEGGNVADRWLMGESVILGADDRKQVIQHLFEWTDGTVGEIAASLEMTPAAVEQAWNRLKKKARLAGEKEPWRRVYGLRDKDLKQNDMEEVA